MTVDPARLVARADHVRWSPLRGGVGAYKEWFHFSVSAGPVDALANFSLAERPGAPLAPRLTLLVRDGARWRGEVRTFPADALGANAGDVGLRMGDCAFFLEDGCFRLRARSSDDALDLDLVLEPQAHPALVHNVRLGPGPPLHWLMAPRLTATGRIRADDLDVDVDGALAYHDHNWGRFPWGGDFAWEWGYALPDDPAIPWSIVFVRMNDRGCHRVRSQGVFVWRGARQLRVFRDREVSATRTGLLRQRRVLKLPPVMGLLHPGSATDVPARFTIAAARGDDAVEIGFEPEDVAQILVPNDRPPGATLIQEVAGRFTCRGTIDGEPIRFSGRTVAEFLRG